MLRSQLPVKQFKTGRECVNWKEVKEGFEIKVGEQTFTVVKNENVEKVSKTTGKAYKTRRLTIADVNGNTMEVGTESFKKGSFVKRFNKLYPQVEETPVEVIPTVAEKSDVERQNELYRILMERGLIQAYSDYEYGKPLDKTIMDKLEEVFDIVDGIDMNVVQELVDKMAS